MELKPNTKLQAGKLTIIKKIGSGGFGITYLAEHALYGRIALKEFFLSTANAYCTRSGNTVSAGNINGGAFGKFKQDFINEAKTLHQLKDIQNVVNVYDYFEENNTVYFFMEYIEGESLQSLVDREGKLPLDTAISYIQQIGNALIQVHKKGILHRDIKPENIIINTRNNAILIDFGIARDFVEGETKTHTGMATMGYAPPEQLVRRAKRGAYTDVFSLGGTLYFCLTGQRPQTPSEINLDSFQSPKSLNSKIPKKVNDAIVKAMTMRPTERFQRVEGFMSAIKVGIVNNIVTELTVERERIEPKIDINQSTPIDSNNWLTTLMKYENPFTAYLIGGVILWILSVLSLEAIIPYDRDLPLDGYVFTVMWILWMVGFFISIYRINNGYDFNFLENRTHDFLSSFSKKFNVLTIIGIISMCIVISDFSEFSYDNGEVDGYIINITFFLLLINSIYFWIVKSKNGSKSKLIWLLMIINIVSLFVIGSMKSDSYYEDAEEQEWEDVQQVVEEAEWEDVQQAAEEAEWEEVEQPAEEVEWEVEQPAEQAEQAVEEEW
jgi:serine/threonine protein kinase